MNYLKTLAVTFFMALASISSADQVVSLELLEFDGPTDCCWRVHSISNPGYRFENMEKNSSGLIVNGKLVIEGLYLEHTPTGNAVSAYGNYYMDINMRGYNLYEAGYDEEKQLYTVVVASGMYDSETRLRRPITFKFKPISAVN